MNASTNGIEAIIPYLVIALIAIAIIAVIVLIVVLVKVKSTVNHVNKMLDSAEKEVIPALKKVDPIMDKASLTVDTVNLELLRVDGILENVSNVSDVAGNAANAVNAISKIPTDFVTRAANKVRGFLDAVPHSSDDVVFPVSKDK
ncbi:MAG: DUF948 domain-containing protein [Coriobacteriales bacterium]|nr:DUF948 domain-containing protein [Coriobacteriales bacterium]